MQHHIDIYRHDILEGVGKMEVKCLLEALIRDKIISLGDLNRQITTMDYG